MDDNIKITLLTNTTSNILFHKNQQWIVSNYSILLNAAIIGFYKLLTSKISLSCPIITLFIIVSIIITTFGLISLWLQFRSLTAQRDTAEKILNDINDIKKYDSDVKTYGNSIISIFLTIAIILSLIVVIWIVLI